MGVSGCGKSSVGRALSVLCNMTFIDADDLHPQENVEKMAAGHALTDQDRMPWLAIVGDTLANTPGPVVIGCSALKHRYRDVIRNRVPEPVRFLHLDARPEILQARVNARRGHFMPVSLLQSQFDALEGLAAGELGARINIAQSYPSVIGQTESYVKETMI
ncbi:gluconokinase [Thalassococcus lentus]|uniref:Gluconokinase n=1 Tax=Thalassococcus lentus TaxID=1210524 RepID=A0ABT4XQA2_9RHOB|nr:gluconokinase [Thalassococcus lentus]MDA7424085.1 gluconokinase [Thalassococcus lentus]